MALSVFYDFKFDGLDIGSRKRIATPETPSPSFSRFPLCSRLWIALRFGIVDSMTEER
jgi:hypothetical protein